MEAAIVSSTLLVQLVTHPVYSVLPSHIRSPAKDTFRIRDLRSVVPPICLWEDTLF